MLLHGCCWCWNVLAVLVAVVGIMYAGCYLRILPVPVMRAWFAVVIITNILVMAVVSFLVDLLRFVGVSRRRRQILNTYVCRVTFGAIVRFNPQVRIHIDSKSLEVWSSIPKRSCLCLNHTSFWDAFLFVALSPWSYIYNARTLMKASLQKLPIFGTIFDRVGHFPVYFKSDEDGNFSVDKDRQAPVMERVQTHLNEGGRICLFPEGAVNKTPTTLNPFRRGTFGIVMENRLPLYFIVTAGNEATWPPAAALGGLPTDIVFSVHKFDVNFDKDSATDVAERLQAAMQTQLDANNAKRHKILSRGNKQS